MEIRIKAIHFDATAKLEEFINKKAQKLARRNESVTGFDVTLKVVKPETAMNKEASIKLTVPNSEDLFASKVADTFEKAVDLAIDALDRQLVKLVFHGLFLRVELTDRHGHVALAFDDFKVGLFFCH